MNKNPLVSIIVPTHNDQQYLTKCLDSLMLQTLENYEVIIIDDLSDTPVLSYVKMHPLSDKIKCFRTKQRVGPGGARNLGLKHAVGKYIGFCDSDDWIDYNFYSTGVEFMDKYSADIGMFSQVREYDEPLKTPVFKCKYDSLIKLNRDLAMRIMTYQYNMGIKVIPPCTNKIYLHSFLQKINASFKERIYFQDVLFTIYTFLNTDKIICIPDTYYHHYKRTHSIIQSYDEKHVHDFHELFLSIKNLLIEKGCWNKYKFNYYKLGEHFYNLIIREIFEFVADENAKKQQMQITFSYLKDLFDIGEFMEYSSAEQIRRHIQPNIMDTTIY